MQQTRLAAGSRLLTGQRTRGRLLAGLAAALLVAFPGGAAQAATAERPEPPTTRDLEDAPDPGDQERFKGSEAPSPSSTQDERIFPDNRVVSLYGAPQLSATILGKKSPSAAGRTLRRQAREYKDLSGRPVRRAFDLIATIATADAGSDGDYSFRQSNDLIRTYLRAARDVNARLVLDVQPGRSTFMGEVEALRRWIEKPDVDLALDPEWNVGADGVPGQTAGFVRAATVNRVSAYLRDLVRDEELPQKMLIVHQFREGSIRHRDWIEPPGSKVATTLNFDGIGTRQEKTAGYEALQRWWLFDGFSLFYELDDGLMTPRQVVNLRPRVDYAMYQ